jgi:hypothetical protein
MQLVVHASAGRHRGHGRFLLRLLGNHGLSRHEQSGNRGRILQGGADDLGRVDDTLGRQVTVLAFLGIVAVGISVILADLADDDRSILAGIDGDLASALDAETALELLQAVYRNKLVPLPVRIRCAVEALPYENPKLSAVAVASMSGNDFAMRLDRAILRSGKLIEAKAIEPPQAEGRALGCASGKR